MEDSEGVEGVEGEDLGATGATAQSSWSAGWGEEVILVQSLSAAVDDLVLAVTGEEAKAAVLGLSGALAEGLHRLLLVEREARLSDVAALQAEFSAVRQEFQAEVQRATSGALSELRHLAARCEAEVGTAREEGRFHEAAAARFSARTDDVAQAIERQLEQVKEGLAKQLVDLRQEFNLCLSAAESRLASSGIVGSRRPVEAAPSPEGGAARSVAEPPSSPRDRGREGSSEVGAFSSLSKAASRFFRAAGGGGGAGGAMEPLANTPPAGEQQEVQPAAEPRRRLVMFGPEVIEEDSREEDEQPTGVNSSQGPLMTPMTPVPPMAQPPVRRLVMGSSPPSSGAALPVGASMSPRAAVLVRPPLAVNEGAVNRTPGGSCVASPLVLQRPVVPPLPLSPVTLTSHSMAVLQRPLVPPLSLSPAMPAAVPSTSHSMVLPLGSYLTMPMSGGSATLPPSLRGSLGSARGGEVQSVSTPWLVQVAAPCGANMGTPRVLASPRHCYTLHSAVQPMVPTPPASAPTHQLASVPAQPGLMQCAVHGGSVRL